MERSRKQPSETKYTRRIDEEARETDFSGNIRRGN